MLARVLLLVCSLAFVFVLGEIVLRIDREMPDPPPKPPGKVYDESGAVVPQLRGMQIAGRNVRGIHRGVPFETNDIGIRGPDYRRFPGADVFRIGMIGDSITMGWGVRVEDAYPARVEKLLKQDPRGRRIEVMNLALAGMNAAANAKRLRQYARQTRLDLLVWGYTLNDLEGPAYRKREKRDDFDSRQVPKMAESHLWHLLAKRLGALREAVYPAPGSYVHELDENYLRNPEALEWLDEQLQAMADQAEDLGVCKVMLIHPRLSWLRGLHPFDRHYDVVEPMARAHGFEVVRGLPAVRGERDSSLWVNPYDPHPNARGHELLAEHLAPALRELPEHCWQGSRWRQRRP